MNISIIVFEVNEIDGLRQMMPQLKKELYDELVIVDGGSTDGTIEYLKENKYNFFVQKEKGVGAALNEAFKRTSGDIVIIYAPDGSFLPEKIPVIVKLLRDGYDIVNVSRYKDDAKSYDDTFFTWLGNQVFTKFANLVHGCRLTDLLYTYIGFKRKAVLDLGVDTNAWTWGQILLLRSIRRKMKIIEISSDEPKRIGGAIKMPKIKASLMILEAILKERFFK